MNKKIILPILSGAAVVLLSASTVLNAAGTSNWTGSPIDGGPGSGGQCSACHSTSGTAPTLAVSASPAFGGTGSNLTYAPNTNYTITITPSGSSWAKFGFNCEIINSQSASTVSDFGTWGAAVGANTQIYPPSSPYPTCASHSSHSTTTPFKFAWKSPASGTGYLYADVLGCNGDGNTSGDHVSSVTTITLTASTAGINNHSDNEHNLTVFPNPATDNLRLTYTLTERGMVSVKLFNLNGDLVANLLNETQEVGIQSNNVHLPSGLAKGMYMVKLLVNGQQSTQKLMVY